MRPITSIEIAEKIDITPDAAYNLATALVRMSLADLVGKRKPVNGRGASENVYIFDDDLVKKLSEIAAKLLT